MDGRRLRLTTGAEVRARIAEIVLGDAPRETRIGDISLEPHQISAVARIELALEEFGGALLCDEVGMGKTFVAAAAARKFTNPLVVAPAALAEMWRQALAAAQIGAEFVSFEKLSSVSTIESTIVHDLLIVDEAHHARNRATRRYRRLRELARNSKVLLLSATPIHNHRGDLLAVLSLFLGSRSSSLTPHEIARCAIRREHADLRDVALIPTLLPVEVLEVADDAEIVPALMNLPEPVPTRGGGIAPTLIAPSVGIESRRSRGSPSKTHRARDRAHNFPRGRDLPDEKRACELDLLRRLVAARIPGALIRHVH
ncbi:MAG: SNF2-related protein [Gemmatimonadaceae bacterium]